MTREIGHCGHQIMLVCEKCERHGFFNPDRIKYEMKIRGWKKKWSWRKLRRILVCPTCATKTS